MIKTKGIIFILALLLLISSVSARPACDICDDDLDEIVNKDDSCPDSGSVVVDTYGCSCDQKTAVTCKGDWCCGPNTDCAVSKSGVKCVGDSDRDGIFDEKDKCRNTPSNELIDNSGCSCSQKVCDDNNPCTDDKCNAKKVSCVFVKKDSNYCGDLKECKDGTCIGITEGEDLQSNSHYMYDSDQGILTIVYTHSKHTIRITFEKPVEEEITVLDSTSKIINQQWNKARTRLKLVVEGDPDTEGITRLKTEQKPISITIDKKKIEERKEEHGEEASPRSFLWIYGLAFLVTGIILTGLVLSLKRHKSNPSSSINKRENRAATQLKGDLQLKRYMAANLQRGYPAQQIRNELLNEGWNPEVVDKAFLSLRR